MDSEREACSAHASFERSRPSLSRISARSAEIQESTIGRVSLISDPFLGIFTVLRQLLCDCNANASTGLCFASARCCVYASLFQNECYLVVRERRQKRLLRLATLVECCWKTSCDSASTKTGALDPGTMPSFGNPFLKHLSRRPCSQSTRARSRRRLTSLERGCDSQLAAPYRTDGADPTSIPRLLRPRAGRGLAPAIAARQCQPSSAVSTLLFASSLLGNRSLRRSGASFSSMAPPAPPFSRERRIACIQFASKHADVPQNTDTVLKLVAELVAERGLNQIDLAVLPELALTGYVFENREEIEPLLEDASTFSPPSSLSSAASSPSSFTTACRASCTTSKHPSLTLASHLAQHLTCHVVIGFPERAALLGTQETIASSAMLTKTDPPPFDARPPFAKTEAVVKAEADSEAGLKHRAFNSAALFAPDGSLVHVFRKHFLFETDEVWASEGDGFETLHLPVLGNVCVAICMDLNPYKFRSPFESCELATFCRERDVDLLVMPMAWLLPKDEQQQTGDVQDKLSKPTPSLSTINYWAMRCQPFFVQAQPATASPTQLAASPPGKLRYFIAANRTGIEAAATFAGSSCALQMKPGERPILLDCLSAEHEACLVVTLPP